MARPKRLSFILTLKNNASVGQGIFRTRKPWLRNLQQELRYEGLNTNQGAQYQVLVLLQQEDGQDPDAVDHEEGENHLVPELLQGVAHLLLLLSVLLQRLQVLLDQVAPEIHLASENVER